MSAVDSYIEVSRYTGDDINAKYPRQIATQILIVLLIFI